MSSIPPNWIAPAVQSPAAQARAVEQRERDNADESRRSAAFDSRLREVIQDVEGGGEVDPEAEGAGSQGRSFQRGDEPPAGEDDAARRGQSDEPGGLDIRA